VSRCFDVPVTVEMAGGRWVARAEAPRGDLPS
jgi:hypothetical protein